MSDSQSNSNLEERLAELERQVTYLKMANEFSQPRRSVRRRSKSEIFGWPLWEIAAGPDFERGETFGHARAFFAMGDVATGVFALGGVARGMFALGGVALGGVTLGGVSCGLLLALGGVAIGGVAAGGAAIGILAFGGLAIGYAAVGGCGIGTFIIDSTRQDPVLVAFFRRLFG